MFDIYFKNNKFTNKELPMVKVIDKEPHKSVVKEKVCRNCGVTLSYVPMEVKTKKHYDYGGGCDSYDYIDCPNCEKKVEV